MRRTRHNPVCSKEQRRGRAIAALSVLCLLGFIGTFLAEAIAAQQNGWRTARGVILTREEETSWDINLEMYAQRYRYQVEYKTVDGERKTAEIMTETPYADSIFYVSRTYYKGCMLDRSRFLADHAATLLAVNHGESRGGTAAAIRPEDGTEDHRN